jgi:hypothetical protein
MMYRRRLLAEWIAAAKRNNVFPVAFQTSVEGRFAVPIGRHLVGKVNDRPVCGADKGTLFIEAIEVDIGGYPWAHIEATARFHLFGKPRSQLYAAANFDELLGPDPNETCPIRWAVVSTFGPFDLEPAADPEPPTETWRDRPPLL